MRALRSSSRRAEFRVWHKDEDTWYIMFEKVHTTPCSCKLLARLQETTLNTRCCAILPACCCAQVEGQSRPRQVRVDTFPRGSVLMNELMQLLMARVKEVRRKLRTRQYITFIQHLGKTFQAAALGMLITPVPHRESSGQGQLYCE